MERGAAVGILTKVSTIWVGWNVPGWRGAGGGRCRLDWRAAEMCFVLTGNQEGRRGGIKVPVGPVNLTSGKVKSSARNAVAASQP